MSLNEHVSFAVKGGSLLCSNSLGFASMPEGYALMLNADRSHYYWIRYDGVESVISWDKWSVYRGAVSDSVGVRK
ncbi:hypothetical protein [Pseudoalteromonas phage C7]|uniref:hypothetical protein n=1 Tax=Pseudoalteromonas phage C7 TaxID=2510494 RepID=UPI0010197B51|nr:hypothetical protein PP587_gp37 [Pseudoalteromonas phage C7]QAY17991.1 hypothetical protein [Pseudoalteromonas phage C7]